MGGVHVHACLHGGDGVRAHAQLMRGFEFKKHGAVDNGICKVCFEKESWATVLMHVS